MNRFFLPVAVSEAIFPDANQLAMAIGEGPADAETWTTAAFQDADGNRYAVRALWVPEGWISKVSGPLERPEWDSGELVDMDAVARAQAAIRLDEPPAPGLIVACTETQDAEAALAAMGLAQVDAAFTSPALPEPVDTSININTADFDTLRSLHGVDAIRAQAIIDGRPWAAPMDLAQIDGISAGMVEGWMDNPGLVVAANP